MDNNLSQLEKYYNQYMGNIKEWIPEGVIEVNLNLLQHFCLLNYHSHTRDTHTLTRYFHLVETPEKITLINQEFIIWIVPEKIGETAVTYDSNRFKS